MRLYGHKLSDTFVNLWEVPNLWLQKFPAEEFVFTAKLKISAKAASEGLSSGLIVMGWDYCRLGLTKRGDDFVLTMATCADAEQGTPETIADIAVIPPTRVYEAGLIPNMECDITLRVSVAKGAVCTFAYSLRPGKFVTIPRTFKARAGKWIGAKVGFYSITPAGVPDRGWIDIEEVSVKNK